MIYYIQSQKKSAKENGDLLHRFAFGINSL